MRNRRYDKIDAIATEECRQDGAVFETRVRGKWGAHLDFSSLIEISDADYRSMHLPCDALEEKSERKTGR